MDIRYSDEQRDLRDSAARLVDRLGVRAVSELDDDRRADKLDAAVAESGWRWPSRPLNKAAGQTAKTTTNIRWS
jgi:hypothetical protein